MADYIDRQDAIKALDDIISLPDLLDTTRRVMTMARDIVTVRPSPWVSVTDRLPERDGRYLCVYKFMFSDGTLGKTARTKVLYYRATGQPPGFAQSEISVVTHWMPLPDLPWEE